MSEKRRGHTVLYVLSQGYGRQGEEGAGVDEWAVLAGSRQVPIKDQ